MSLSIIANLIDGLPAYRRLREILAKSKPEIVQLEGVAVAAKGMVLAKLRRETGRPIIVISYNGEQAERIVTDAISFGVEAAETGTLPQTAQTLLYTEGTPDYSLIGRRLTTLRALADGDVKFVAGSAAAFLQRTVPAEVLSASGRSIQTGQTIDQVDIERALARLGYERVEAVEMPGQWTRRGGIVDVFSTNAAQPWRIDFFGDEIESIRAFDPETQRSTDTLDRIDISPAREMPLDDDERIQKAVARIRKDLPRALERLRRENLDERGEDHAANLEDRIEGDIISLLGHSYFDQAEAYFPLLYAENLCALDYLPSDALIVVDEPHQLKARWDQTEQQMHEIAETRRARGEWLHDVVPIHCEFDRLTKFVTGDRPIVLFSLLARPLNWVHIREDIAMNMSTMEAFHGRLPALFESISSWHSNGLRTVFVTRQPERIREMSTSHKVAIASQQRRVEFASPTPI
jgi:transcription-repair coupling factor (superfamily II helicase)